LGEERQNYFHYGRISPASKNGDPQAHPFLAIVSLWILRVGRNLQALRIHRAKLQRKAAART
jgi:hypothetical protein